MELKQEEEEVMNEPVSPPGQYFNSSVPSIRVLAVLELEIPIDESDAMTLLQNVFLPINPRFSSIRAADKNGGKQWKRVEVKLRNHVKVPNFPVGLSVKAYDKYFDDYISRIALEPLPENQPLWEIHILNYPTSNAAGNLIFKLHHALGDGFSLMGALLSCLQRVDNPYLPLTFPSLQMPSKPEMIKSKQIRNSVPITFVSSIFNTISDLGWSLLKSSLVEDVPSAICSGEDGVEFKPITLTTMTFSLDRIKEIKTMLGVMINDVITSIIFFGVRLYMQAFDDKSANAHCTTLVLMNTRIMKGYKSVKEMVKPSAESPWGNHCAFLHISLPEMTRAIACNPLQFVKKAQKIIKRKRSSLVVNITGRLLEAIRKLRGPEVAAKYVHSTLKNLSMAISNVIGPVENMALSNYPIKGLYFMLVGGPQSLAITMVSYTRQLRVAVVTEKNFIDPEKFKSCIENSFEMIYKSSYKTTSRTT